MSTLDEYAADVVRRLPNPPRTISTLTIVSHMYRTHAARWILEIGFLGLLLSLVFAFVAEGALWVKVLALGLTVPMTLWFVTAPGYAGLLWHAR